jgi:hypothetical protein
MVMRSDTMTTSLQKITPYLPFYQHLRPRRFQAFCVGAAKTGTHSLAAIFERHYRSAHEPSSEQLIGLLQQKRQGRMSPSTLQNELKRCDRRLWLEMNASQINGHFVAEWVALFPDAKFILTVREPIAWLRSITNHQLARPLASDVWQIFRQMRFATDAPHSAEEAPLANQHLYTLDGYLSYWAWHNQHVLDVVPSERLLVISTAEIDQRLDRIARFLGISADTLTNAHAYRAKAQFDVIDQIDRDYLHAKVDHHCATPYDALMAAANAAHVI